MQTESLDIKELLGPNQAFSYLPEIPDTMLEQVQMEYGPSFVHGSYVIVLFNPPNTETFAAQAKRLPRIDDATIEETRKKCLKQVEQMVSLLDEDGVEDGMNHPADTLLADMLSTHGDDARRCLSDYLWDTKTPSRLLIDLLHLVCRMEQAVVPNDWLAKTVTRALSSDCVSIRDVAAQLVSAFKYPDSTAILENHSEPIEWLKRYMGQVLRESRS